MTDLSFAHLREVNVARCVNSFGHALDAWSVADWMVALGGEIGEALNVVKKLNRERDGIIGNTKPAFELRADLGDEIADAVIYLDLLLAREGIALGIEGMTFDALDGEGYLTVQQKTMESTTYTLSDAGFDIERGLGRLADAIADSISAGQVMRAAQSLLTDLAVLAELEQIDLGHAVVRKFNATSDKRGAAERLVA